LFSQPVTALAEKPPASAAYRGSDLVPWQILLQKYFGHPRAKDFSKIGRQCATLIQKCIRCDTIVARFYSTER